MSKEFLTLKYCYFIIKETTSFYYYGFVNLVIYIHFSVVHDKHWHALHPHKPLLYLSRGVGWTK